MTLARARRRPEGEGDAREGQKARVALARAVYSRAQVLILDDILAALDVHTAKWTRNVAEADETIDDVLPEIPEGIARPTCHVGSPCSSGDLGSSDDSMDERCDEIWRRLYL